jgi:Na+-transporting NADH:ubiquinone oxidoreductase subunit NqrE
MLAVDVRDEINETFSSCGRHDSRCVDAATLVLIGVFIGIYTWLVRPKSLRAGLGLGALVGVALGVSVGLGTFIHMPIPSSVAWGWFLAGCLKGLVAGAVIGVVIVDS